MGDQRSLSDLATFIGMDGDEVVATLRRHRIDEVRKLDMYVSFLSGDDQMEQLAVSLDVERVHAACILTFLFEVYHSRIP